MKQKTCKACKEKFTPQRSMQSVCSPGCGLSLAKAKREKQERKEVKARKEKLKTRSDWIKDAQTAFNRYVRLRDNGRFCIDGCGAFLGLGGVGGGFDCGHYRSTGSAPNLRFDERNAHGQSKHCNRYLAGRAVDYRLGLINRIGLPAVEALEADNTPRKFSIDELKAIIALYRQKAKELG